MKRRNKSVGSTNINTIVDNITFKLAITAFEAFASAESALQVYSEATELIKEFNSKACITAMGDGGALQQETADPYTNVIDKVKQAMAWGERASEFLRRLHRLIYESSHNVAGYYEPEQELVSPAMKLIKFDCELRDAKQKMEKTCFQSGPKLFSMYQSLVEEFNRSSDFYIDGIQTLSRREGWIRKSL